MSVTVSKAEGVTVFTLTSDPDSICPPLCQIFKGLCYSPTCCSVSQHLKKVQSTSQSILGTLHIIVALLTMGLSTILICSGRGSSFTMDFTGFPFWLGALFILFGIMCIVSEKRPSPCLVILNVILNIAGVAFAIAAIVLYSFNLADIYLWWICHNDYYYRDGTQAPVAADVLQKCEEGVAMINVLLKGINSVLIILSALEFCVALSSAILGIKTLCAGVRSEDQSAVDPEMIKPLLEEATVEPQA